MASNRATDVLQQRSLLVAGGAVALALATTGLLLPSARRSVTSRISSSKSASAVPFEQWVAHERLFSFSSILAAFGPDGASAPGTKPGVMIASPSRPGHRLSEDENENYYFQWPRDGSMCLRVVVDRMMRAEIGEVVSLNEESAKDIERRIRDFVDMNLQLQVLENPSGTFETGGLGEAKFNVDGSAFTESWGRPQNDGPAQRASTLIKYAVHLLNSRPSDAKALDYIRSKLFSSSSATRSIIRDDLDYVARAWREDSYDLWEEVKASGGGHFYTLMQQRRALIDGARFACRSEVRDVKSAEKWEAEARHMENVLEEFWNPTGQLGQEGGPHEGQQSDRKIFDPKDDPRLKDVPDHVLHRPHICPTLRRVQGQPKPLQADVAVLLAMTHGGDGEAEEQAGVGDKWTPWGERSLASLDRLAEVFSKVYTINKGRDVLDGVACGRYPEDSYDGVGSSTGHAWFICTQTLAEVLHLSAAHFSRAGSLSITPFTLPLWRRFVPDVQSGQTLRVGDPRFEKALKGIRKWGDAFLETAQKHADKSGKMSEQIHRETGAMRGARELTWSYASWSTAADARQGKRTNYTGGDI